MNELREKAMNTNFSQPPGDTKPFPSSPGKRATILLGLALVLMLCGFALYQLIHPEPSCQGKTLRQWIGEGAASVNSRQLMSSMMTNPAAADQAIAGVPAFVAVKSLGAEAVPTLMECLKTRRSSGPPSVWGQLYFNHIANSPYLSRLLPPSAVFARDPAPVVRFAALCLMGMNRISSEEQVALLVKIRKEQWDYSVVGYLLKRTLLSPEPVEPIIDRLCKEAGDNTLALELFDSYGVREAYLVKHFIPLLADTRAGLRQKTVFNLREMGPLAKPALPALMNTATHDSDHDIRRYAVGAIGAIGPGAKEAIPFLVNLVRAEDRSLGAAAANAIKQIDPQAALEPAVTP